MTSPEPLDQRLASEMPMQVDEQRTSAAVEAVIEIEPAALGNKARQLNPG